MNKTVFLIKKMDCPSEEQMIRMKLADNPAVRQLSFDLDSRKLTVCHDGGIEPIISAIDTLNLSAGIIETSEIDEEVSKEKGDADSRLLWTVLLINFSFFVIELVSGLIAHSMGLIADSLDMLADAFVYGLSLYAISGTLLIKKRVAGISGLFQAGLAVLGFIEIIRRFIGIEDIPSPAVMIIVSLFALAANAVSLMLLNRSQSSEVHIRSSRIFTSNDVIANIGVIIAGVLVLLSGSKIPDLIVGSLVFLLVLRGAVRILQLAK